MKKGVFSRKIAEQFKIKNNYDDFILSRLCSKIYKPVLVVTCCTLKGNAHICLFPSSVRKIYSKKVKSFNAPIVSSTILFIY